MYPLISQKQFSLNKDFNRPQHIVSLVPSQTELLSSMGLDERVVGITKYCIHPAHWQEQKAIVGGTKNISLEKIKQLRPDLIIANKEENIQEQVEALTDICSVYISEVDNLNSALEMILQIGLLVGTKMQAESLVNEIFLNFEKLEKTLNNYTPAVKTFAYLIWRKPYMAAGGDTFINNMLQKCRVQNVFADKLRYPAVTIESLQQAAPDILFLSSEPYPFGQKHLDEWQTHLPNTKIQLVDGEMFSWYGSRLLKMPDYYANLVQQLSQ